MPTYFIVRATVADPAQRAAFDAWYAKEHLPDAAKTFGAQKAWRFWSESDPAVHMATYRFADRAALDHGTRPEVMQAAGRGLRQRLARRAALARDRDAGAGVKGRAGQPKMSAPVIRGPLAAAVRSPDSHPAIRRYGRCALAKISYPRAKNLTYIFRIRAGSRSLS